MLFLLQFYERIAEQAEKEVPDLATGNKPTAPATVLRKDQLLRSRTRLVFTDISKGATAEVHAWLRQNIHMCGLLCADGHAFSD